MKHKKDPRDKSPSSNLPDFSPTAATGAFHFSIAWTLEQPGPELIESTNSLQLEHFDDVKNITVKVEEIKAKVGNVVSSMSLPSGLTTRKALFGM